MTERYLTSPVRLTGSVHPEQLATLIAIDSLRRKRQALGEGPVAWELVALSGDVAVQRAVERAVAREGEDRAEMGRADFADRARQHQADAAADLERLLAALEIDVDTRRWNSSGEEASRAARVAFVRLYEAGILTRSEAVLDTCSSCQTVVDEADTDTVELPVDVLRLSLPISDGALEVETSQPELIVGTVAIAVPAETAPPDSYVHLPLLDAEVPIVAIEGLDAPFLVIPGHDARSYDLARQLSYPVVHVLDADGVVRQPGGLEGLSRYAARSAATEQLAVEGVLVATIAGNVTARRCYRCGTILIPVLGRQWVLDLPQLIEPVITDLESGAVQFDSEELRAEFIRIARQAGTWSVSQQLWAGQPIPVSSCLDCGATRVSVEEGLSCGVCMGTLAPHDDILDARFVAAVTPLAMSGWPNEALEPASTTLCVGRSGLFTWALAIACVGKSLAQSIPFNRLRITGGNTSDDPGPRPLVELLDLVAGKGAAEARLVLGQGMREEHQVAAGVSDNDLLRQSIEELRIDDAVRLAVKPGADPVLSAAVLGR